ncbi:MAG TPA: hypothetical protein VIS05_03005 [Ilumatobacter sp.]
MADTPRYGQVDRDYGIRLATTPPDEDGPIWMVNLMKYREHADYGDGGGPAISGREADDLYTPFDVLAAIGAEVVFAADVDQQLLGAAPQWDRVAIVKYPTRRSFIEMQSRPDFQRRHVHKDAGMETTIVSGCLPIALPAGDPVDWADVPHPPTADDGPVVVIHVLKFQASTAVTPDEMVAYQQAAARVAVPHGVRLNGWFAVEGTILGDGRSWDQIRFNEFPSKAAFMAVALDPARLDAQHGHREVAIADTYTMILRAHVNRLAESIAAG